MPRKNYTYRTVAERPRVWAIATQRYGEPQACAAAIAPETGRSMSTVYKVLLGHEPGSSRTRAAIARALELDPTDAFTPIGGGNDAA